MHASDIFSFGAVLYEMVTGRKPFDGDSRASLIAAILERDPTPIATFQPEVPALLTHIVDTCLAKNPMIAVRRCAICCVS